MILLPSGTLILSYNLYTHKSGGFCITLSPDGKVRMEEIELLDPDTKELMLEKSEIKTYANRTPIYKDLIEQYFNELKTKSVL